MVIEDRSMDSNVLHHAVFATLVTNDAFKELGFDRFPIECSVQIVVNGKSMDFEPFMLRLVENIDKQIENKAKELIKKKISGISESLYKLEEISLDALSVNGVSHESY